MKKFLLTIIALVFSTGLFNSCNDLYGEQTYPYQIEIAGYNYIGGPNETAPLNYISRLGISRYIEVNAFRESEADIEAIAKFDTEMKKIDPIALQSFGGYCYIKYVLTSREKIIAYLEFGVKPI